MNLYADSDVLCRTYLPADGLAGVRVEHIAEDALGFLWFATWGSGVSSFDGGRFRTYTTADGLVGDLVYSVLSDRAGRLWFGAMDGGLTQYADGTFRRPRLQGDPLPQSVTSLFEDAAGRLWLGGIATLGYIEGDRYRDLTPAYQNAEGTLPPHECWGIVAAGDGTAWFGFRRLVHYDGTGFRTWGDAERLPRASVPYAIADAGDGRLWVGTDEAIGRFDGHRFEPAGVEVPGIVRKIQTDRNGRTWFCTYAGTLCFDGRDFDRIGNQSHDHVNAVYLDAEDLLWLATWGGGVSCLDRRDRLVTRPAGHFQYQINALHEDSQRRLWVGGMPVNQRQAISAPVFSFNPTGTPRWEKDASFLEGCLCLCDDGRGRLWLGGANGLIYHEDGHYVRLGPAEGFAGNWVTALAADGQGRLYIGHLDKGQHGAEVRLSRYGDGRFETLFSDAMGDWQDRISAVVIDDAGQPFFGRSTQSADPKGVCHLTASGPPRWYSTTNGLVHDAVSGLYLDRHGHLWIATWGGIGCLQDGRLRRYAGRDLLPSDQIHCFCEDDAGRLWIGTDGGAVLSDGDLFQTVPIEGVSVVRSIIQDHRGDLVMATDRGVIRHTPGTCPPRVYLDEFIADSLHRQPTQIDAAVSGRLLGFSFRGISTRTQPQHMLYSWRLKGLDDGWTSPQRGAMRTLYQDVPPGRYRFEVRAIDTHLNPSATAALPFAVADVAADPAPVTHNWLFSAYDEVRQNLEVTVRSRTAELEASNAALRSQILERQRAEAQKQELETKLLQTQKLEAIGQMTAGMAHNFNNLLMAISGNLEMALEQPGPSQEDLLKDAALAAQRAAEIVRQLMLFTRGKEAGPKRYTDVRQTLDETVAICRETFDRSIALQWAPPDAPLGVDANAGQLQQVFLNLCLNARDALEEHRPPTPGIHIRALPLALQAPRARALDLSPGPYISVEIADNGGGMPPQIQDRVFEPFYTTKEVGKGTGLGLSTAYGIIQDHRGHIDCTSRLGIGTRFRILLPAVRPPAAEAAVKTPQTARPRIAGNGRTVLVIDDDPVVRSTLSRILQRHDYQVIEAADGHDGLQAALAPEAPPDLVLLDFSMPGLSGRDVAARLRAEAAALKIILISGYYLGTAQEMGVDAILQKPVDGKTLLHQIHLLLAP